MAKNNDNDNPDFRTVLSISGELPKGTRQGEKVKGFARLYKTGSPHTYIIEPKQDQDAEEEDMEEAFQPPPEPKPRRQSRKKTVTAPEPKAPSLIDVQVELAGFGTVPTKYGAFDEGSGCLRLEICDQSWIPPRAERDDDGKFTGAFSFANLPGKAWLNIGLEFRDRHGHRNIILVQTNGNDN